MAQNEKNKIFFLKSFLFFNDVDEKWRKSIGKFCGLCANARRWHADQRLTFIHSLPKSTDMTAAPWVTVRNPEKNSATSADHLSRDIFQRKFS
jgi:hypothetical protein